MRALFAKLTVGWLVDNLTRTIQFKIPRPFWLDKYSLESKLPLVCWNRRQLAICYGLNGLQLLRVRLVNPLENQLRHLDVRLLSGDGEHAELGPQFGLFEVDAGVGVVGDLVHDLAAHPDDVLSSGRGILNWRVLPM